VYVSVGAVEKCLLRQFVPWPDETDGRMGGNFSQYNHLVASVWYMMPERERRAGV